LHKAIAPTLANDFVEPGFEAYYENENQIRIGPRAYYDLWNGGDWQRMQRTAHCTMALLVGCLGSLLAMRLGSMEKND
jgi:hypothetical protein